MVKFFNLKTVVLSVLMAAVMLPSVLKAQRTDGFFRGEEDNYVNRDGDISITGGITNESYGAPVGSGLLILTAAGAGYAALRRRKAYKSNKTYMVYRSGATLVWAFALLLGMTQCKKNFETLNTDANNGAYITLSVDGAKAGVTPGEQVGDVTFSKNDIVYVAYNGVYVGSLTYNGSNFAGTINAEASGDERLYFYFLGNSKPTFSADQKSCSVMISDQAGGTLDLPVISFAGSDQPYTGAGAYSAHLRNKSALVKFNVTKPAGYNQLGTVIMGVNNQVTVDFTKPTTDLDANNGFSYSMVNDGKITIGSGIGEVWAIMLPREESTPSGAAISGRWEGTRDAIPAIEVNDYIQDGINVVVTTERSTRPTGSLSGLFSVNASGKQVRFSKGNLKFTRTSTSVDWSTGAFSFMDNQYDKVETFDYSPTANYANKTAASLFGWATSNINHGATYYQPYSTYGTSSMYSGYNNCYKAYGDYKYHLYNQTGKADWGYNDFINEDEYKQWRTLTSAEWGWLLGSEWYNDEYIEPTPGTTCRTSSTVCGVANARYAKVKINNSTPGIVIFPDSYTHPEGGPTLNYINYHDQSTNQQWNTTGSNKNCDNITSSQWAAMEAAGAVFLPVTGRRNGTTITNASYYGYYWTSEADTQPEEQALNLLFNVTHVYGHSASYYGRQDGYCVRLVCE